MAEPKNYTLDEVMAFGPCHSRNVIKKLFGKRETLNAYDVAGLDISASDKSWILGKIMPLPDNFILPEGVTDLRVINTPALTELNIPEGVTDLWVINTPALTELNIPEGVTGLWVINTPAPQVRAKSA